jgi:hypothetical protein
MPLQNRAIIRQQDDTVQMTQDDGNWSSRKRWQRPV